MGKIISIIILFQLNSCLTLMFPHSDTWNLSDNVSNTCTFDSYYKEFRELSPIIYLLSNDEAKEIIEFGQNGSESKSVRIHNPILKNNNDYLLVEYYTYNKKNDILEMIKLESKDIEFKLIASYQIGFNIRADQGLFMRTGRQISRNWLFHYSKQDYGEYKLPRKSGIIYRKIYEVENVKSKYKFDVDVIDDKRKELFYFPKRCTAQI